MAAMPKYIGQAHVYQKCIAHHVVAQQAEAESKGKTLDKAFLVIEDHRIAASKANEKKIATQVEITIAQFNQNGSDCTDGGDIVFQQDGPAGGGLSDAGNDLDVPG
jgi:galactokinase